MSGKRYTEEFKIAAVKQGRSGASCGEPEVGGKARPVDGLSTGPCPERNGNVEYAHIQRGDYLHGPRRRLHHQGHQAYRYATVGQSPGQQHRAAADARVAERQEE